MTFAEPLWFWAFALLPLFMALFLRNELQRTVLVRRFVAARLAPYLAGSASLGRRRLRFFAILLAVACLVVALARPRWGYTWEKEKHHGRDILIAIDVSKSMLANDLSPSRLARAKLAAEDLIDQVPGDRVGLIAFAGTAFLQAPLTFDHGAVLDALHELDTDIIPRGGTDIAEAIRTAVDAFGKGESDDRALILFTDGEELEESAVSAASEVKDAIRIFTVGVGSAEGTVIALPNKSGQTEYVKDPDGQIVKSRLDESRLREIGQTTNGFYVHLVSGPAEMQQIVRDGLEPMSQHDLDSQYSRHPIERYQWPLGAGMILLACSLLVGDRKRSRLPRAAALAGWLLMAGLVLPVSAKNTGVEAYEQQDYKGAYESFDKQLQKKPASEALQFDLGSAAYKTGNLDRALQGFGTAITSNDPSLREKAEYNLGNTLFQRGINQKEKPAEIQELKNALQHYEAALKVQPQDANAQYNRDAVKNLIAELEKEPPPSEQQKQKDQQKQDQQKKDQKQDQKQDQQSKEQKDKDQQKNEQNQKQQQSQGGQQKDQQNQQNQQNQQGQQGQKQPQASQQQGQGGDQKENEQNQSKGEQKEQQNKEQSGQQQKPPEDGKNGQQGEPQKPADPSQDQPDRKLSGEIKGASQPQPAEEKPATPEQQAAEDARAAEEGRMTEAQARDLLESLKEDDRRVRLLKPKDGKAAPRSFRDW